ncbi:YceI family protein [Nitratidesulfovibrio liaohensis]|uniref:YceI family protein n=1 Tax=Nitratidesulfovibrio liaohensis TaxID=2604158 RepID=A0ABY9R027_9BACT|nr:YceI family protein [Nitratidesulfovibrio liaohensis]WMW65121.1 YceI family protein [Nitratidesulfovibrio liaohensis]
MATVHKVRKIGLAAARAFVEGRTGIVLDVMVPEHFEQRHIPGAAQACVHEVVFCDAVAALVPDLSVPMLVYGAGAGSLDGRMAAEKLLREGHTDVRWFAGGLEAWCAAGLPLEGGAPHARPDAHPPVVMPDGQYALDAAASVIRWTGRNDNGAHHGTVDCAGGSLAFSGGRGSGGLRIDMRSIRDLDIADDTLRPVLEAHLASDDFFFTALFPQATLEDLALTPLPSATATTPNYRLAAQFALRGVHKRLALNAAVRLIGDAGGLALAGHCDLDRTRWGVLYGSARFFRHLGYHRVDDAISLDFRLVYAPAGGR